MSPDTLKHTVTAWANEAARDHLTFIGDAPFKDIPADKVAALKAALVFYAELGAREAVNGLINHGNKLTL